MKTKRIGIFGGTFSPFHLGHLNCALSVADENSLDELRLIPAHQSPHRDQLEGPTGEERLEMVRLAIEPYRPFLEVDDRELRRGGISYTFDTLEEILDDEGEGLDLFLVMGSDQFQHFDSWKEFDKILEISNIIVVNRPGVDFPSRREDLPPGLRSKINEVNPSGASLKTGGRIKFQTIEEFDISGSEIRRRLRSKQSLSGLVPEPVEKKIIENGWYGDIHSRISDYNSFASAVGRILIDKRAINVLGFELGPDHHLAEFTIVASGTSTRHTKALAENLIQKLRESFGVSPQNIEGKSEGRWIVLDYGSLLVHLFYDYARMEYRIEELWKENNKLDFSVNQAGHEQNQKKSIS